MAAEIVASDAEAMAPSLHADAVEEKKMVMLRSEDGVEFVVSAAEASQCGRTVDFRIKYPYEKHIIPSGDGGGETSYSPIHVSAQGDTLSRVIQYSKLHNASAGSQGLSDWDAEFIRGFDHQTLFDLIVAARYLRNRGLLDLTCRTVANVIKGKSFDEVRAMFNIRSYVPSLNNKSTVSSVEKLSALDKWLTATPAECSAADDDDEDPALTLEQNAVKALHIVRCQDFTAYDPQRNDDFVCTRFCSYNIAFFDLDQQSKIVRGPPLDRMPHQVPISRYGVQSSLNVVSLKVTESLMGYDDLSVFGTVLARDEVDYKCLYLFRREMDDAQAITSPDDMLSLTDPCRALVLLDDIYFEIDLKIKCDGGEIKDLSRGVISFEKARLPADLQTMTISLTSWLSTVELACAHVYQPVEATIAINIFKGPCNISRVSAWTGGNDIILYDSEADGTQTVVTGDGGSCSVPLTRRVVVVPFDEKLVLHLVGYDNIQHVSVTLGQSDEEFVFKMGLAEVQVKVVWTIIRKRRGYEFEIIGNECLLH